MILFGCGDFMKYTNMVGIIKNIGLWIFVLFIISILLGAAGLLVWCDFYVGHPFMSFLWLGMIPALGLGINCVLGYVCGDEYYNTGVVIEGRSVFDVVKTPRYYKRRMIFNFIECFLLCLLVIRFILFFNPFAKMIYGLIEPGHMDDYDPSFSIGVPIVGIIVTLVELVICFIIAMSSYEQSDLKYKKEIKVSNALVKKKEKTKKKAIHKFKFNKYPGLLEKYEAFKVWYFKKYETYDNEEEKNKALEELNKAFESVSEAVYNTFNEVKPTLILKKTGMQFKWDEVIDKPYNELTSTQKLILVRLLDKLYKYVLPKEYYNY